MALHQDMNFGSQTLPGPYEYIDFLPALKDGDSFCKTAKPRRENVLGGIGVTVVNRAVRRASPFLYS